MTCDLCWHPIEPTGRVVFLGIEGLLFHAACYTAASEGMMRPLPLVRSVDVLRFAAARSRRRRAMHGAAWWNDASVA